MTAPDGLSESICDAALALGFARVGITSADPLDDARAHFTEWLGAGLQGGLAYLSGPEDRADARTLLASARSIIVVALPYRGHPVGLRRNRDAALPLVGEVARYAVGSDYHRVMKDKLFALGRICKGLIGPELECRACVDTAPLLERAAAQRAGVGFTGKSTMTIAPGLGTYFLIGELVVDASLTPFSPRGPSAAGCGRCTACLDACPTGAFVGPYVLDAKRCISYLTIETKGPIPEELRPLIGTRVFGCDVCQDVCPFNGSESPRPVDKELEARPELEALELIALLELGSSAYRRLVRRSALRRVGKHQLQRNAAVALGNTGDPRAIPPLIRSLAGERSPLVRAHAAWALGRLGGDDAKAALTRASSDDTDADVRKAALDALGS